MSDMSETKTHTGGCHCGNVRYEVTTDLGTVISCNCSICSKSASLLAFVAPEQFKLLSGEGKTRDYQFNKHVIHHLFCTNCGIKSYAHGTGPDGKKMVAVNVRCFDEIDLSKLNVKEFDGKRM